MAAACQRVLDEVHYTHVHLVRLDDGQLMISEDTDMPNNVHRFEMSLQEWESHASYDTDAYRRAKQATCEKFRGHHYTDICRKTDNPWGLTLASCYLLDYDRMSHIRLNAGALTEEQQQKMMTTICVAAYAMALGQLAGTTDVVFMTTNHGRIDKRLNAKVLGNFLKCVSLRINTDPEQSVAELIGQTRTALFGMMRTIGYPWTHMVRDLQLTPEEQVGTEMNVSGSGIYEYCTVKGVDYPSHHIEMNDSNSSGSHFRYSRQDFRLQGS